MAGKKSNMVTLKVPPAVLKALPVFIASKKRSQKGQFTSSRAASPAHTELISHYKINTGPKEMSTLGLTMNSLTGYKLDKTSKVKKWTKKSANFKTFTGFEVKYVKWNLVDKPKKLKKEGKKDKEESKKEGTENGDIKENGETKEIVAEAVESGPALVKVEA